MTRNELAAGDVFSDTRGSAQKNRRRSERDLVWPNAYSGCSKALKNRVGLGNQHGDLVDEKIRLLSRLCGPHSEFGASCAKNAYARTHTS